MTLQDWFILINFITTIIVGVVLSTQIKSQKSILDSYKDFVSAINPNVALQLKDIEIEQTKKNMSNDIQILQKQVSELSYYVNHVIEYAETTNKEIDFNFDRDSFITNNLPSCRALLDSHKES